MRRFPTSWKETRAALGLEPAHRKPKRRRKTKRKSRHEPLEDRRLLSVTPQRPVYAFATPSGSEYDPADQFVLTTEYDAATDQPSAVLTLRGDLNDASREYGLQEIEVALRLGDMVLQTQSILVDIAEPSFLGQFRAERTEAAGAVLAEAPVAGSPTAPSTPGVTVPIEQLLDVETFLAGRRSGAIGSAEAVAYYTAFRNAFLEAGVLRDSGSSIDDFDLALDRLEQLGSAGSLLTGQLRLDAASSDGDLAAAARGATEVLGELGGSFYTIFSGLGVTHEIAREENFGGAEVFVLALVEAASYEASDSLRVELGDQPAMVQAFITSPGGVLAASQAASAQVGTATRDTYVSSTDPAGTTHGNAGTLGVTRQGADESHAVFSIDLSAVDALAPGSATITLDATTVTGPTDHRLEAHFNYWDVDTWDESTLTWSDYQATLANGFRSINGATTAAAATQVAGVGGVTFDATEAVQRALLGGDTDANGEVNALPGATRGDLEANYLAIRDPERYATEYAGSLGLLDNEPGGGKDFLYRNDLNWDGAVTGTDLLVLGKRADAYGDFNLDGVVDGADYSVWQANFGLAARRYQDADGNADGVVDAADYTVWSDGEERADTSDPYNGNANPPELTFRVVPDTDGSVTYTAPTAGAVSITTSANAALSATRFHSPASSTGWEIGYEVLHDVVDGVVVEVYQTAINADGSRGASQLAYQSLPLSGAVGPAIHAVPASDISLPDPGAEHVLEVRVTAEGGSVVASRDFSHGLFYDTDDGLHAYGSGGDSLLQVNGLWAALWDVGITGQMYGPDFPIPTAVYAQLGEGVDELDIDLAMGITYHLDAGSGDDLYRLDGVGLVEATVAIRDRGGFDTLAGNGWQATEPNQVLDLRSAEPQAIAFASPPTTLTIDFEKGGEIQLVDLPTDVSVVGPGYGGTPLTVDNLGSVYNGDLRTGEVTLREAIELSNRLPGAQTIDFAEQLFYPGPATIVVGDHPEIHGDANEFHLRDDVTIQGPGRDLLTIDAANSSRLFRIDANQSVAIRDLTGRGGLATGSTYGGAIYAVGELTLDRTAWVDNAAPGNSSSQSGRGGVIWAGPSDLTIRDSVLRENTAQQGGVVYYRPDTGGRLRIENSSLVENRAVRYSGGGYGSALAVYSYSANAGSVEITNSTISNNAADFGAVILVQGSSSSSQLSIDVLNSTVVENAARNWTWTAGIIDRTQGVVSLRNSVLFDNRSVSYPFTASTEATPVEPTDGRGNLDVAHSAVGDVVRKLPGDSGWSPYLSDGSPAGVQVLGSGEDAGLLPLSDDAVPFHPLIPDSIAINAGDTSLASHLPTDQRGGVHQRIVAGAVDLGAIETHIIQTEPDAYAIYGTGVDDAITVAPNGVTIDRLPSERLEADLTGLATLEVHGLSGDDIIAIDESLTFPTLIDAGAGNDFVLGGGGNDVIEGRAGSDTLRGRAGTDTLSGHEGADLLIGGDDTDPDALLGGPDYDDAQGDWFDTIDLGSGQNNTLSEDETPDSTYFGSPVWTLGDSNAKTPSLPSGESFFLRHDTFDSDNLHELDFAVFRADGSPLNGVQLHQFNGLLEVRLPANLTNAMISYDLVVEIADSTPAAPSAGAGAVTVPPILTIPFKVEVVPQLELNAGFGATDHIWNGPDTLISLAQVGVIGTVGAPWTYTYDFGPQVTGAEEYEFSMTGEPSGAEISTDGVFTWELDKGIGPGAWRTVVTVTDDSYGVERTAEVVGYFGINHLKETSVGEVQGWADASDGTDWSISNARAGVIASDGLSFSAHDPVVLAYRDIMQPMAYDVYLEAFTAVPSLSGVASYGTVWGDPLGALENVEITVQGGPEWGEVSTSGSTFVYTPGPEFPGYDEFEYSVKGYDPSEPHKNPTADSNTAIVRIGGGVAEVHSATVVEPTIEDDGDQGGLAGGHDCCACSCGSGPSVSVAPSSGAVSVTLPGGGHYRSPPPPQTIVVDLETRNNSSSHVPSSESTSGPPAGNPPGSTPLLPPAISTLAQTVVEVYGIDRLLGDIPIRFASRHADVGDDSELRSVFVPLERGGSGSVLHNTPGPDVRPRSAYYNYAISTWGGSSPPEDTYEPNAWVPLVGGDDYGFGIGWNFAEVERLVFRPDDINAGKVFWLRPDGRVNSFDGVGVEANRSSGGSVLSGTAAGLVITDAAQNRLEFDDMGWIARRIDPYGNALEYEYEDQGNQRQRLVSVTSTRTGDVTEYVWQQDAAGRDRVIEIIDPKQRVTRFAYNSNGTIRSRELPGPDAASPGTFTYFGYNIDRELIWVDDDTSPFQQTKFIRDELSGVVTVTTPEGEETATHITNPRSSKAYLTPSSGQGLPSFPTPDVGVGGVDPRSGSRVGPDGRPLVYSADAAGRVAVTESLNGVVTSYEYNDRGQVLSEEVVAGGQTLRTAYEYDAAGRLLTIFHADATPATDTDNPTSTFTYDLFGRTTAATDELGRTTTYAYTDHPGMPGALQSVVTTRVVGELGGGDDLVVAEFYGTDGLIERTVAYRNDIDGAPLDGLVTEYTYTTAGLADVVSYGPDTAGDGVLVAATALSVQVLQRDDNDYPIRVADELGRVTTYEYNDLGQVEYAINPWPGPGMLPLRIDYTYDHAGRLETATQSGEGNTAWDAPSIVTSYSYDSSGRVTTVNDSGRSTTYGYDDAGNLAFVRDSLGRRTDYEYDLLGRMNRVILPDPDGTNPARQSPIGYYAYDAFGRLTGEVDPAGGIVRYEYDARGRVTEVRDSDGPTQLTTDDAGQLNAVADPASRTHRRTFDDAGRLVSEWSPGRHAPTTYQYDTAGNLRFQTDPLGETTELLYDAFGRLFTEIDPNGAETHFTYYDDGQLHTLTDPEGNQTTWVYDLAGRLIQERNESNDLRSFRYDTFGRLVQETDRLGRVISYEYDSYGFLDEEEWYADQIALQNNTRVRGIDYNFDSEGQLTEVTDRNASYQNLSRYKFTYDALGLVTKSDLAIRGIAATSVFINQYDRAGRRTQQSLGLGNTDDYVNTYAYDTRGRVTRVTQAGVAGGAGVAEKRVDFGYSSLGQIESIDRYADLLGQAPVVATTVQYDWASRVERITHGDPLTASNLVAHGYEYDSGDRLVRYSNSIDGDTTYQYDARGQLLGVDHPDSLLAYGLIDESYQYDDNGNRLTAGTAAYTTEENNRLTSDGTYTFTYDLEGNRTARFVDSVDSSGVGDGVLGTGDTDVTQYEWDHRNRLTTVITLAAYGGPELKRVEHTYDAFNQWIGRLVTEGSDTSRTAWLYDNGQAVLQFDRDDAPNAGFFSPADITHRYLWGPGVDQLLADEQVTTPSTAGETLWALTDHLGTVRDLAVDNPADATGDLVNHRVYDSYGNLAGETDAAIEQLFGYTGKAFDEETGLQNNLNRWYDPEVGRWISEDPIGFAAGDANLSRYVGNGATTFVDPSGLASQWHHLLPQQFRALFERVGFDIDSAEFGWIIDSEYHLKGKPGNPLHNTWNECWGDFLKPYYKQDGKELLPDAALPSRTQIAQQLESMERSFSQTLRNGVPANMSHGQWRSWLGKMRHAASQAQKLGTSVKLPISKGTKALGIITFTYNVSTGSVSVAAEGAVEDAFWPLLDIGRAAAQPIGDLNSALHESGRLNRRLQESAIQRLLNDPNHADIPGCR